MSPDELPGIPLKFLHRFSKKKCPKCGQTYRLAKLKRDNGIIYELCPNIACRKVLARHKSQKVPRRTTKGKK
jgi:hypothetical protein